MNSRRGLSGELRGDVPEEQISVQRASRDELADLTAWYGLVESATVAESPATYNAYRTKAFSDQILGAALDLAAVEDIMSTFDRVAAQGDPETGLIRQILARTLVLSARKGSMTVGMLEMGPATGPYRQLLTNLLGSQAPASAIQQVHMDMAVRVTKLHMVAVLPEHRGLGFGRALVSHALDVARQSASKQVYGQFDSASAELAGFYTDLGFTIRPKGSSLRLVGGYEVHSRPSENLGYQMLRRPRAGADHPVPRRTK